MKPPTINLDTEAAAMLTALATLTTLPGYHGPTVEDVRNLAAETASRTVTATYQTLIGKAK